MLDPDEENPSDYINGSYINGYEKEREYIATQGPNKYSVNDFWRMIWQVRATRIVMITNLVESGKPKCNLYWPAEKESCLYGKFHVKLLSQEINPDYTIRSFQVSVHGKGKGIGGEEERE